MALRKKRDRTSGSLPDRSGRSSALFVGSGKQTARTKEDAMNTTTPNYDFPLRALAPRVHPTRRRARNVDELVERLVLGDPLALASLKWRFAEELSAIAETVLENDDEVKELVDQVFEDASRGWPPERGLVRPWFRRLMRRALKRHVATKERFE
jgi:hypothetical protein